MATTSSCGTSGSIAGGVVGVEITAWEFIYERDNLDATNMTSGTDNGYKQSIGCIKRGSGTFTTNMPSGGVGAMAAVVFTNAQTSYTANIIVTGCGVTVPVEGLRKFNYSFVTTGAIT